MFLQRPSTHPPALIVGPLDGLEQPLARVGVIDEGVALRTVDQLEMLRAGLAIDRLFGHGGGSLGGSGCGDESGDDTTITSTPARPASGGESRPRNHLNASRDLCWRRTRDRAGYQSGRWSVSSSPRSIHSKQEQGESEWTRTGSIHLDASSIWVQA